MKIIECKYCHKKFETDGSRRQAGIITAHMRMCTLNPNRQKNIDAQKRGSIVMNRIICERQLKKKLENDATRKNYTFQCIYCGKPYMLNLTERDLKRFNEGKKGYRRCCQECWHSVGGKAAAAIRKTNSDNELKFKKRQYNRSKKKKILKCLVCGKDFEKDGRKKFCSTECQAEYHKNRKKYLSPNALQKLSAAGKRSAAKQSEQRRSKCEILFCQLCEQTFQNVSHNIPMFNGWDADIILPEQKIAILWNGPWHYKSISKKAGATLCQIQNRDILKKNEIMKAGWSLYIIKDIDSRKSKTDEKAKTYVENHFNRFLDFIHQQTCQFFEEFEWNNLSDNSGIIKI